MRGVRGAGCGQRRGRSGLVDADVEQLPVRGLLVGEEQVAVDRDVVLAVRVVDLRRREERVHAERACLIGDDRHDSVTEVLLPHEVLEHTHEAHRGGDLLLAGSAASGLVGLVGGQLEIDMRRPPLGGVAAELRAALLHVLDLGGIDSRVVVRRQLRVLFELLVRDRDLEVVTGELEVVDRELLHLVCGVAGLEVRSERIALDRLDEDDGRLTGVLHRGLVCGEDLAVVVAAALEVPDLLVAVVLNHRLRPRVAAEEVVAHESAGLALVGLVVAVGGGIHEVDESTVAVLGQQCVPFASPDDLDDVPAGTAEVGLELLHDLAVAADGPVEALQVAVDDEVEVVELFESCDVEHAAALGLVELAVTEEGPGLLL